MRYFPHTPADLSETLNAEVLNSLEALFGSIVEFECLGAGLIAFDIGYSHGIAS